MISVSGFSSMLSIRTALTYSVSPFSLVTWINRVPSFPAPPANRPPRAGSPHAADAQSIRSSFQVHDFLQDFVGRGDDAGVRLEAALRDDHFRKFRRQVHVGHLQL